MASVFPNRTLSEASMRKIHFLIFFLLTGFYSFSQVEDSLAADKWVNFNRPRGTGDNYFHNVVDKQYITKDGDTLVGSLFLSAEYHQILKEQSFLHDKQNGLEIVYYPNGVIHTIDYYLNGRLWDVVSLADSNGRLQNPGNLHNGTGIRFFSDEFNVEPNGYMTYKN
jgi:antitoxin component YwqK of YwqJK toxin-antitoxin module